MKLFEMDLVDGLSLIYVGQGNFNLSVHSSWSQQSWIKNVSSVGSSEHNDILICGESVHLDKKLVQGVVSFVVSSKLSMSLLCHGINLINEYD